MLEQVRARACRRSRRTRPEAVSTAARIAPVPGHSPPGIGIVGSWLVAKRAAPRVERPLRRQQLLVVEVAVAGDDDRVGLSAVLALEQLEPGRRDHLLQRRGADHEGAAALARGFAGEPGGDHPGGDDLLRRRPRPPAPAAAPRRRPAVRRDCW